MKKFYRSNKEIEIEFTNKDISRATIIKPTLESAGAVASIKEYDITELFTNLNDSELINIFSKGKVNSVKEIHSDKEKKVVMNINLNIDVELKPYTGYSELEKRLVI